MKKIKVEDIRSGKIGLGQVKEMMNEGVDRKLLFAESSHEIAKAALLLFDSSEPENDLDIENQSRELLSIFRPVKDNLAEEILSGFNELYLNVEGLPIKKRVFLEIKVLKDLKTLDEILLYYREHTTTKPIIEGRESARNHQAYGMMEFYKRTVEKRAEVEDYRANKLDGFVLSKSKPGYHSYSQLPEAMQSGPMETRERYPYLDFVINDYKVAFVLDREKLDWRCLNPIRNKIFTHTFSSDYTKGYTSDVKAEIMNDLDTQSLLDNLVEKVRSMPRIMGRKEIFEELRDLFNINKFYGFYALALPQVEGIFAEMSQLIKPTVSTSGGLPEKVNRVRPHSETAHFGFDYYEYYLPDLRNKFSHLGKDNDIEFKSRCLLLDLTDLLNTCEDLTAPIIHLTNLINGGTNEIRHIGDLAKIMKLTEETKRMPDFNDLKNKLDRLIQKDVPDRFDLPALIGSLQDEYNKSFKEVSGFIDYSFQRAGLPSANFAEMKPQDVIAHLNFIKKGFEEFSLIVGEPFKFLFDIYDIGHLLPKLFPGSPATVTMSIKRFIERNAVSWQILNRIRDKVPSIPEEYFIGKTKRIAELKRFTKPSI